MGKLIQCSSVLAKKPYCFPMTKTRVYSIEEVCYYIKNNIYMMQEEVFDQEFADWIREELQMPVTADKLDQMRKDHNNLKDIVVTLCCSCDYYTEQEINRLIAIMDETQNLSPRGRRKIKADNYLYCGSVEQARREYEGILKCDDMLHATPEEYAVIYHSLGVVCGKMGDFKQAANAFRKAYEQGRRTESLQAYLQALRLGNLDEEYDRAVQEMEIPQEMQTFLRAQYNECMMNSHTSKEYRQIQRIEAMVKEGNEAEAQKRTQETIHRWKQEYREIVM